MIIILPDRTQPYPTKLLMPMRRNEWRTPSLAQPKDWLGNETKTRFRITARLNDGYVVWRGWFDDREDADAFLWAIATGSLGHEPALWDLPQPAWCPGMGEGLVYDFATVSFVLNGTTTWNVPADWNNTNNSLEAIGGGGTGGVAEFGTGGGGGGGAYSKVVNQTYTPSASRTVAVGAGTQDTSAKQDDNSTTAILAKGGAAGTQFGGGNGGASGSGTGTTKYSGGNGHASGGGGGAAGLNGAGNSATNINGGSADAGSGGAGGTGGGAGGNGTEWDATHGSGGGGGGTTGATGGQGGLYGGGSGGDGTGAGTAGRAGLLVITHTPGVSAYGFNLAMMGM